MLTYGFEGMRFCFYELVLLPDCRFSVCGTGEEDSIDCVRMNLNERLPGLCSNR